MTVAVFVRIFKSDGSVGEGIDDFEGSASAVFEFVVDFGPFGLRQDAAVKPLCSVFCE